MELRLPENTDARELLTAHFDVRPGPATRAVATFYDTFDGRLHGGGVTLRHKEGRLTLLDRETGEELAAAESTAAKRFFDHELPGALREPLADVIEMRALLPMARVRAERRGYAILNEDAKTVVRLYVEHGRLTRHRGQGVRSRARPGARHARARRGHRPARG